MGLLKTPCLPLVNFLHVQLIGAFFTHLLDVQADFDLSGSLTLLCTFISTQYIGHLKTKLA